MGSIGFAALGQTIIYNNRLVLRRKSRSVQLVVTNPKSKPPHSAVTNPVLLEAIRNKLQRRSRILFYKRFVVSTMIIGITTISLCTLYNIIF